MHSAIAAAAYVLEQESRGDVALANSPWQQLGSWRLTALAGTPAVNKLWLQVGKALQEIAISGRNGHYQVAVMQAGDEAETEHFHIELYRPQGEGNWRVDLDGTHRNLNIAFDEMNVSLSSPRLRRSYAFLSLEESQLGEAAALSKASNDIRAAMPGLITDVLVKEGDVVEVGQTAVVMEAMKLIHNLACPVSGTVKQVLCATGDKVADGALLIDIEPAQE